MTHELLDLSVEELEAQEAIEIPERELMQDVTQTCSALINLLSCIALVIAIGTGGGAAG